MYSCLKSSPLMYERCHDALLEKEGYRKATIHSMRGDGELMLTILSSFAQEHFSISFQTNGHGDHAEFTIDPFSVSTMPNESVIISRTANPSSPARRNISPGCFCP
jgi:hypothetical protein